MAQRQAERAAAFAAPGTEPAPSTAPPPTMLAPEDANQRYGPIGPDGKQVPVTDKPIDERLAEIIGRQKTEQIQREGIQSRFAGAYGTPASFAVGAIASLADPTNAALLLVPPLGEGAILGGLARAGLAGGIAARTIARAGAGAITGGGMGAAGAALQAGLSPDELGDHAISDALREIGFGAAGFAAFHAGFGGLRDAWRYYHPGPGELPGIAPPGVNPDHLAEVAPILTADAPTTHAALRATAAQIDAGEPITAPAAIFPFEYRPPQADTAIGLATQATKATIVGGEDAAATARRIAPDVFAQYDPLEARAKELKAQLADPETTIGAQIDQRIADARQRAEAAATAQQPPLGLPPEELRQSVAAQTAAHDEAVRELAALQEGRPTLVAAATERARQEQIAVDRQMRDLAPQVSAATRQGETIRNAALANRAVVMGPRPALPDPPAFAEQQQQLYRNGFAPGMSQEEFAAANDAVYGEHPTEAAQGRAGEGAPVSARVAAAAPQPGAHASAAGARAVPSAPETVFDSAAIKRDFTGENGAIDLTAASDHIATLVHEALADGQRVIYHAEGKEIPITSIDARDNMRDAEGKPWGTMLIATDATGKNHIEIMPPEKPAAAPPAEESAASEAAGVPVRGEPGVDPEIADLERRVAELPPEALAPEDHAELARSAADLKAADDKAAGYDEAGQCLTGRGF
jgi:hypothetical protein